MSRHNLKQAFSIGLIVLTQWVFIIGCVNNKPIPEPVHVDTSMDYIRADHDNIQYTGRIDFANPLKPAFSFPGVSIKAKFEGSAIDVVIKEYGTGTATTTNFFNIVIDGVLHTVLEVNKIDTLYSITNNLSDAEHVIEVFKRTEASVGKTSFWGFQLRKGKRLLPLPSPTTRKIEFIGDSFTCGYGNEKSYAAGTNTGFHSVNENNYTAWGAIVSRSLNARYHCTAYSGRGLYRNNSGTTTGTLPSIYERINPDAASPTWVTSNYIPDLIVIHLGTNDFFPEQWATPSMVDSASYVNTYISFITSLRSYYPASKIVCVVPNSLSDYWPENFKSLSRIRSYTKTAVKVKNDSGDNAIYSFELATQTPPYGEDWHPSNATHQKMADQITPFLKTLMGW